MTAAAVASATTVSATTTEGMPTASAAPERTATAEPTAAPASSRRAESTAAKRALRSGRCAKAAGGAIVSWPRISAEALRSAVEFTLVESTLGWSGAAEMLPAAAGCSTAAFQTEAAGTARSGAAEVLPAAAGRRTAILTIETTIPTAETARAAIKGLPAIEAAASSGKAAGPRHPSFGEPR